MLGVKKSLLIISIFLLAGFAISFAQPEMSRYAEREGPIFHFDLVNVTNPNDLAISRLKIITEIAYDELQFVKVGDGYEASYEVSAIIFDKDGDQADGKIWKQEVFVTEYDQTNKREVFDLTERDFDLEPGKYKVSVSLQDLETNRSNSVNKTIKLKDFTGEKLQLSDIQYGSNVVFDSVGIKSFKPQVTDPFKGLKGNVYAIFEICDPRQSGEATIKYEIRGERTKEKIRKTYTQALTGALTQATIKLPIDSLSHDTYRFKITVNTPKDKKTIEKQFYVRWSELPVTTQDLNTAIEQVRYIATREEWKRLKKAPEDKKLEEFKAFWKRHDPTPGTEENEAMEAHYARVEYANRNFSVMQREGWRTDMGMIYILLGAPDDVTREAFPRYSNSYEIWHYYRFNRSFEFYDQTGFGDFRLVTPFSLYEYQRLLRN